MVHSIAASRGWSALCATPLDSASAPCCPGVARAAETRQERQTRPPTRRRCCLVHLPDAPLREAFVPLLHRCRLVLVTGGFPSVYISTCLSAEIDSHTDDQQQRATVSAWRLPPNPPLCLWRFRPRGSKTSWPPFRFPPRQSTWKSWQRSPPFSSSTPSDSPLR